MQTIRNLQSLRAIGAIMIFAHHFGFGNYIVTSFGDCAVCWFMMLSGFVSYGVWRCSPHHTGGSLLGETFRFLRKRITGMAPLYYIGLLFALILGRFMYSKLSVVATAVMMQSWIPDRDVFFGPNAASWFVSSLLFCLVLFPTLRRVDDRRLVRILLLTLTVYICALYIIPEDKQLYWIYIFPPMQFPAFLIGMCLWLAVEKCRGMIHSARSAGTMAVLSWCLIILSMVGFCYIPYSIRLSSYWWVSTAFLIFSLTVTDAVPCLHTRIMHLPLFQRMGDASMSFYLLHIPWICGFRIILRHLGDYGIIGTLPRTVEFSVSIAILWCVSLTIHHLFYRNRR